MPLAIQKVIAWGREIHKRVIVKWHYNGSKRSVNQVLWVTNDRFCLDMVLGIFCLSFQTYFFHLHPALYLRMIWPVWSAWKASSPSLVLLALVSPSGECWQETERREESSIKAFVPLAPFLQRKRCGLAASLKKPSLSLGSGNTSLPQGGGRWQPPILASGDLLPCPVWFSHILPTSL